MLKGDSKELRGGGIGRYWGVTNHHVIYTSAFFLKLHFGFVEPWVLFLVLFLSLCSIWSDNYAHTHTSNTFTAHTFAWQTGDASTYRYKLPVPFGGRLESKRQRREEGRIFEAPRTERVKDQIQWQWVRLSFNIMETNLMLKTTGKG